MRRDRSTMAQLKIVSADNNAIIHNLNRLDITLYDINIIDELTFVVHIHGRDYKAAMNELKRLGTKVEILNNLQRNYLPVQLVKRPVLAFGLLLIVILSVLISRFIIQVRVEGNETVPTRLIQEQVFSSGVKLGAFSRRIRSEQVKNQLLETIPQLQWAGVNIEGCVATVRVRENALDAVQEKRKGFVTNVVASKDGIVESVTVTEGQGLCAVGDAVKASQILISGYTDCGSYVRAGSAEGEVFAKTLNYVKAVLPTGYAMRSTVTRKQVSYYIKIGKNLLKIDNSSGISPAGCVKMYEESYWSLPGGFVLPICVVRETVWVCESTTNADNAVQAKLQTAVRDYLKTQMVAGEILHSEEQLQKVDDCVVLQARYLCREMIGRRKNEIMIQGEANSD